MDTDLPIIEGDESRSVWEELNSPERRRVYGAVRRGEAIHDPGFASLAVSVARREQRNSRAGQITFLAVLVIGTVVTLWALTPVGVHARTLPGLLGVTLAGVVTPIVQLLLIPSRRRRARRAEDLNLAVVAGRASHDDPLGGRS